jgi:hypothetical protein
MPDRSGKGLFMEMDIGASRFDVKESPGKIVIQDKIEKMILTGNFNTADALKEVSEYFNGPGRVDIDGIESYFQWESGLRANLGDDVYSGSEYVKVPLDEIKIGNQNFKIGLSPGRIVIQDEEYRKYYTGNFDAAAAQTVARDLVSRFNGENINLSGIDRYIESKREARDGNIYRNIDDDTGAEVTDLNTKQERRIGASRFEVERSLDEIVFKDGTEKYTLTGDFNTVRATAEIVADVENYFEGRGNVDVEEIDTYLVHDSNFRRNIVGRDFDSADSNIERIDIGDRHSFKVGVSPGKVVFQDEGASEIRYTGDFDIITARTMVNSLVDRFDGQSADINDVTGYIKDRMTAQDDNIYRHNITRVEEGEQENEADRENAVPGQEAAEAEPAETVKAKSPEEAAFLNALHQRKVIVESLKAGTLALPERRKGSVRPQDRAETGIQARQEHVTGN